MKISAKEITGTAFVVTALAVLLACAVALAGFSSRRCSSL